MLILEIRFPFPSRRIFQSILFSVFVIAFHKLFIVCVFEIMQIRMCIHHALNKLQFANGNIRTVIAYSLEICKNIIQNKSQLNGAFAVLKPFDMRGANVCVELVNNLFKRLNTPCGIRGIGNEPPDCYAAGEKFNFFSAISRAL